MEVILQAFPFASSELPVRYLGLPLLTKRMTANDYTPLIEKIREKIGKWTTRHLSFAGPLQLISSVIQSLSNFWMSAFWLPTACIKEIDSLCSAFLWSGPKLSTKRQNWLGVRYAHQNMREDSVCVLLEKRTRSAV